MLYNGTLGQMVADNIFINLIMKKLIFIWMAIKKMLFQYQIKKCQILKNLELNLSKIRTLFLKLEKISLKYGKKLILDNLNFKIKQWTNFRSIRT